MAKSNILKSFVAACLIVSILLSYFPVALIPVTRVKAADESSNATVGNSEWADEIEDEGEIEPDEPDPSQPQRILGDAVPMALSASLKQNLAATDLNIPFEDFFGKSNAKIILKKSDYTALKALYCISQADPNFPDYNNNLEQLAQDSTATKEDGTRYTVDELLTLKSAFDLSEKSKFSRIVREALAAKYPEDKVRLLVDNANPRTLECITGLSANNITQLRQEQAEVRGSNAGKAAADQQQSELDKIIENSLKATKIDIRIIKTLVYLVTPVDRGGAGHRRIKANRIFQHREYSTESDALLGELKSAAEGRTAAEVGQNRREEADAAILDPNGVNEADVWFDDMTRGEDNAAEVNRSAHADGQAVDISEVDDIRCTVIKRRHLGKDSRIKQDPQPVKLAWQSEEGYNKSGGNNAFDLMEIIRNQVRETYQSFAADYGTNISGYDGDLSNANIGDLATLMGRALFSESINSPGHFFDGENVEEVMQSLGAAYLADLFKVPRSVMMGRDFEAMDDIAMVVGEAAVEQSTKTPIGILEPFDDKFPKEVKNTLRLYLEAIGRRRLAYEMNLSVRDLDNYGTTLPSAGRKILETRLSLPDGSASVTNYAALEASITPAQADYFKTNRDDIDRIFGLPAGSTNSILTTPLGEEGRQAFEKYVASIGRVVYDLDLDLSDIDTAAYNVNNSMIALVGKKSIEKSFSLTPGALDATTFEGVKNRIGPIKSAAFTYDPTYVDKTLHIALGSTRQLLQKSRDALELSKYINLVGQNRINDTVSGFKFLAAHDAAYSLPPDTWVKVVGGSPEAFKDLGVFQIAQAFADEGDDDQQRAITALINDSLNLPTGQDNSCTNASLKKTVRVVNEAGIEVEKEVIVSERTARTVGLIRGDLCSAFARKRNSTSNVFERIGEKRIFDTLLERVENEDPDFLIEDGNIPFRVGRIRHMIELLNGIKANWNDLRKDVAEDKDLVEKADSLIKLLETISANSMSINVILLQDQVKQATTAMVEFKLLLEQKKREMPDLQDKINVMIDQINEAYKAGAEAIEGHEIASIDQIKKPDDIVRRELENSGSSNDSGRNDPKNTKIKFSAALVYGLLKHRITPRSFLQQIATAKVEAELTLPKNSLNYYIQNMETRDINGIDAFYQAIGQAKIEEKLGLPENYFQGPIYQDMIKFQDLRFRLQLSPLMFKLSDYPQDKALRGNFNLLKKYYIASADTVTCYGLGQSNNNCGLKTFSLETVKNEIRKDDPNIDQLIVDLYIGAKLNKIPEAGEQWKKLIKAATKAFIKEQELNNKNSDKTMEDVVKNIDYIKSHPQVSLGFINGSIQRIGSTIFSSGQAEIMLKMGLVGSVKDAREPASWRSDYFAGNRGRALEIDRLLNVVNFNQNQITNTEALFTGEDFRLKDGREYLNETEKNEITRPFSLYMPSETGRPANDEDPEAKKAISRTVLDRYLQLLNAEIDAKGFRETRTNNVYYNNTNPLIHNSRVDASGSNCKVIYVIRGGIEVADSIQSDAYVYVDVQGKPHSFRTEEGAIAYARQQEPEERTFLDIFAGDIVNIVQDIKNAGYTIDDSYSNQDWVKNRLIDYATNNRSFDFLPLDSLLDQYKKGKGSQDDAASNALAAGDTAANGGSSVVTFGDFSYDILKKLFGKSEMKEKPLQWFRSIVGKAEAKRSLIDALTNALPFNVNPKDFGAEDVFSILNGDFRPLTRLGAHLIDNGLGLADNSTYAAIALAESANPIKDMECTAMDAGAQFLGQLVNLDRVPLSGDPAQLIRNIGQAKVETVLGLPRGSFYGGSLFDDGLIQHINSIDFALTISVPLETAGGPGGAETISDLAIRTLEQIDGVLGTKLVEVHRNSKARDRVQAVRDNMTAVLHKELITYYPMLKDAVTLRLMNDMPAIIEHAGDRNSPFWQGENKEFAEAFMARIQYIDSSIFFTDINLGVIKAVYHSFADVLTRKISPDRYNELVAYQIGWYLGTEKLADQAGLDSEEEAAVKELLSHMNCVFSNSPYTAGEQNPNARVYTSSDRCSGWYQNYGQVATNVARFFHGNLDNDLGLTKGSTEALLNFDPETRLNPVHVLVNNAAYDLDDRFKLLDKDKNFQWLFARYVDWKRDRNDRRRENDLHEQICSQDINYEAYLNQEERNQLRANLVIIRNTIINAQSMGYKCESTDCMSDNDLSALTDSIYELNPNPERESSALTKNLAAIMDFIELREKGIQTCKNQSMREDAPVPAGSTIGSQLGWSGWWGANKEQRGRQAYRAAIQFIAQRTSEKISEQTKGTVNISADQLIGLFSEDFFSYFVIITTSYGVNTFVNNKPGADGSTQLLPAGIQVIPEDIVSSARGDPAAEAALTAERRFEEMVVDDPLEGVSTYIPDELYPPLGARPEGVTPSAQMAANAQTTTVARNGSDLSSHIVTAVAHDNGNPAFMTNAERQRLNANIASLNATITSDDCNRILNPDPRDPSIPNISEQRRTECNNAQNELTNSRNVLNFAERYSTPEARLAASSARYAQFQNTVHSGNCGRQCYYALEQINKYDSAPNRARSQARKAFRENLQFRLMDALWYKMDENVYSGFAWALLRGSGMQKLRALGNYVITGLQRGKVFGQEVTLLRGLNVRGWEQALESIYNIETATSIDARNAQLGSFINSAGYTTMETWLNNTLWRNFKFKLPDKFLASVFVSIYTGYWFKPDSTTTGFANGQFMAGGSPIPTLGEATTKWAIEYLEQRIFAWADRQTGWKIGTSYQMFKMAKDIYVAAKAVQAFNRAKDSYEKLGQLKSFRDAMAKLSNLKVGEKATIGGHVYTKATNGDLVRKIGGLKMVVKPEGFWVLAKEVVHELVDLALGIAVDAAITFALTWAVKQAIGKELGKLDKAWNLPPGTMMAVAGVAAGYISSVITHMLIPKFPMMGPYVIAAQLIFVLVMALTSVYKVDVTCSADGYYPEKLGADDVVAPIGLGEWDGSNSDLHKQKSMEASQYEARTLIGDMLKAQFNPLFADVIPNQIMTGRDEDVAYWLNLTSDNICQRIGENYHADNAGICTTGETHTIAERAGVFQNPQNTAFTHVGF